MLLVTGGLGFIGTHVTRALLDQGESCVLVQRREPALPGDLAGEASARVVTERADITDLGALLEVGTRHRVTGIVHLAGSVPWPPGAQPPVAGARSAVGSLLNVVQAACEWQVPRVGIASTIGVYGGVTADPPYREDVPLPMTSGHVIPAFKKIGELLAGYLAGATGTEIISYRISPWGPGGNPNSPFTAAPQLVHAAARGTAPDFSALPSPPSADDGFDMCYVKDCARAIALLQLAPRLNHRIYNIASGTVLTNREVAAAVRKLVPDARTGLPEGRGRAGPGQASASTSPASARTPATTPATAPSKRSPTTSPGCARETTANLGRFRLNGASSCSAAGTGSRSISRGGRIEAPARDP